VTAGAAHRFGLYRSDSEGPARLHVLAAGLPLPGRVHDMLAEATAEAQQFGTKKSQARVRLKRLDLSPLGVREAADEPPVGVPHAVGVKEAAPAEASEAPASDGGLIEDSLPSLDDSELAADQDDEVIESVLGPPNNVLSDDL
jgi:hypothetical protein